MWGERLSWILPIIFLAIVILCIAGILFGAGYYAGSKG